MRFIYCFTKNTEMNCMLIMVIIAEQKQIAQSKQKGELLTWDDLAKMKYSWRVAQETLRMVSPIFGGFRKAVQDLEYDGYLIPKGWQVSSSLPILSLLL
jgi:cytochrome P450